MLRARPNLRKCLESNRVCHLSVYSRARQIDHEYSLDTLHKIFLSLCLRLSATTLNGCGQDCQAASAEKEGVREKGCSSKSMMKSFAGFKGVRQWSPLSVVCIYWHQVCGSQTSQISGSSMLSMNLSFYFIHLRKVHLVVFVGKRLMTTFHSIFQSIF